RAGAERLARARADAFFEKFKVRILQGYGLTETSPVAAVNLPEPKASRSGDSVQPSSREGSVGKLAPGMAARITNPDSDEPLTLHDTGMLWLKGVNIFEGYLDDPQRSSEVLDDGRFRTRHRGRIGQDGFLFLERRA